MNWTMNWQSLEHSAPQWMRDGKFGLFFHWGVYSVPACENEWYSRNIYLKGSKQNQWHEAHYGSLNKFGYKDLIPMFHGEHFDPDAWASLVKRSGAKYAGPVSEHADNYSLWDSQVNPINSVKTGPHRDIAGECAAAFRRQGIKYAATFHHQWLWGWFMSTDNEADMYDPRNEIYYGPALPLETNRYIPYRMPDARFCETWLEKIREVSVKYRPDLLYFDGRCLIIPEEIRYQAAKCYYDAVPDGIITYKQEDYPKGLGVFDVECGRFAEAQPFFWQTDDRLEDRITWCIVEEPKYKSAARIVQQIADVTAKNGCLLLNVGPQADGTFHPDAVKELEKVGKWLSANGEAIYATRPFTVAGEGVTKASNEDYNVERVKAQMRDGIALESGQYHLTGNDVRYTQTERAFYIIGFGYPETGVLRLQALRQGGDLGAVSGARMLGVPGSLEYTRTQEALTVRLPDSLPYEEGYVIRLEKE